MKAETLKNFVSLKGASRLKLKSGLEKILRNLVYSFCFENRTVPYLCFTYKWDKLGLKQHSRLLNSKGLTGHGVLHMYTYNYCIPKCYIHLAQAPLLWYEVQWGGKLPLYQSHSVPPLLFSTLKAGTAWGLDSYGKAGENNIAQW